MENEKFRATIFEDEDILIVDKPSGLLTEASTNNKEKSLSLLLNTLNFQQNNSSKIYPCHRLDKETSGVLIFAKGKNVQQKIMDQFRAKKVKKVYIAFVHGVIDKQSGVLKSYIQGGWPYQRNEQKKLAITNFKLIGQGKAFSIMRLEPQTGRTNQIRIQFKDIGHPLVGERRFVMARDWPIKFKRVALHAFSVAFTHPTKNITVSFNAELPKDMAKFLINNGIDDFSKEVFL
ncbi:MAG: RNA pseudouridine synthase [Candidatus Omnitrophica bacterium]|nr:RNA pseudouridine synthase [Candidatus Omnitrophota bacterium]